MTVSSNLFSTMRDDADFSEGYSLETIKDDFKNGRPGLISADLMDGHYYIYYAPILDTDWYMTTTIPYELVNTNITKLSQMLMMDSMLMLGVVVIVILFVFILYITKMRRNQRHLQEAYQQAETANLAKTEFLSRMSHEIRTPMNGIIGMTEIALRSSGDPSKMTASLQKVKRSAQHLLALLNDVLDMSRIESGKIEIQHIDFNFTEVIHNLVDQWAPQIEEKKVGFKIILFRTVDEYYNADPLRIAQILNNLLSNALKFTPKGGTITMEIEPTRSVDGIQWMRFSVKDTGCGIAEENQERIFEAFEQEKAGTALRYGGTGLGLSIVKRFVSLMNGSIDLKSELNKGSVFTVLLPLSIVQEKDPVDYNFAPLKALIAVSDEITGNYLKVTLHALNISADLVRSKNDLLHLTHSYDFYIADAEMIKQGCKLEDVPLLFLGSNTVRSLDEAAQFGSKRLLTMLVFKNTFVHLLSKLEHQDASSNERISTFDFKGKNVLIVEDNEINLEIAVELISDTGATVESACDGLAAVERFKASSIGHFDLILMDIQMPRMDGLEAAEAIRKLARADAGTIPILAMSANAFEEDVAQSLTSGMNAHLSKPININDVCMKMKYFFDQDDYSNKLA